MKQKSNLVGWVAFPEASGDITHGRTLMYQRRFRRGSHSSPGPFNRRPHTAPTPMSPGALVQCPFNLPTSIFHGTLTCPRPRCSPAEAVTPASGYPTALCRRYTAGPRREPEHDGPELERAFTQHLSARTASVRFTQMWLTRTHSAHPLLVPP